MAGYMPNSIPTADTFSHSLMMRAGTLLLLRDPIAWSDGTNISLPAMIAAEYEPFCIITKDLCLNTGHPATGSRMLISRCRKRPRPVSGHAFQFLLFTCQTAIP